MAHWAPALVVVLAWASVAWGTTSPTDAVREVFVQADRILGDRRTYKTTEECFEAVRKLVRQAFDVHGAAELASGARWSRLAPAERAEFTRLFGDLVERAFLSRLASAATLVGGTRVRYVSETRAGATARVLTAMARRDGGELWLEYGMVERDGAWKVRDAVIDGVSLMANYRAQLERVLAQASFDDLLGQMRSKVGAPAPAAPRLAASAPPGPVVVADVSRARVVAAPVVIGPPAAPIVAAPAVEADAAAAPAVSALAPADVLQPVGESAPTAQPDRVISEPPGPASPVSPPAESPPAEPTGDVLAAEHRSIVAAVNPTLATAPPVSAAPPPPSASLPASASLPPSAPPPPPARARTTRAYWLRIAAVEDAEAAKRLAGRLLDAGWPVALQRATAGGKSLVQVRVGPFRDAEEAVVQLLDLQRRGHDPYLVADRD